MTPSDAAKATSSNPNKEFKITKIIIDSTTISLSKPYYVWLTTNSNITCLWVLPNGNYLKLSASVKGNGDCTLTFGGSNVGSLVREYAKEYVYQDDIGNFTGATIAQPTSVSDPMGDYISFLNFTGIDGTVASGSSASSSYSSATETEGSPDRITWKFNSALPKGSNPQYKEVNGAYYLISSSYQLKYKVRLDVQKAGFQSTNPLTDAGQVWYDTNGTTTLTYPGGSQNFEVPQVMGVLYDLKIKKVDAANTGKTLSGAEFMLVGTGNNGAIEYGDGEGQTKVTATSDANGIAVFTGIPCGTYNIVETKAPDGYSPDGKAYSVTLGYVASPDGYATSSAGDSTHLMPTAWSGNGKVITNKKNIVTVRKTFAVDGELPSSELDQTIYIVLQDKTTHELARDVSGSILYKTVTISGGSPASSSVTFGAAENEKILKGEYNVLELSAAPTSDDVSAITLTSYKDSYAVSDSSRSYQLTSIEGTYEYTNSDGQKVAGVSGNNANLLYSNEALVSFTNMYAYEAIKTRSFTANKGWVAADGETVLDAPQGATVKFTLYRNVDGGDIQAVRTIELDGRPDASGETNEWVATFEGVSIADESGKPYTYMVRETDCNQPEFAAYLHAGDASPMGDNNYLTLDRGTIWNKQKTTQITVKKVDDKGAFLPGAKFKLVREQQTSGNTVDVEAASPFTINAEGGYTIAGLVSGTYKLTELSAPDGYVILSSSIEFTVNATGAGDVVGWPGGAKPERVYELQGTANDTVVVSNTPGQALPTTGGSGTIPYTLGGLLVVAAALVYGFRMRLRERRFSC